jgi:nucleoside-diphosphate-sugar epimerase
MNVLIVGGTGSIGPYVVRELLGQGHCVTLFNRGQSRSDLPTGLSRIIGDRRNLLSFRDEFRQAAPELVLDMCAFREKDSVDLMKAFKGIASRVVAVSSQDVYRNNEILWKLAAGEPDAPPLAEDSPLRQNRLIVPAAAASHDDRLLDYEKIDVERVIMSDDEIAGTVLRLPMVYGPGDNAHRMFPYLKRMDEKRPAILISEPQSRWLWTRGYVEDVAHAIALAAVDSRAAGRIYNVGEPRALAEFEWIDRIGRAAGWNGEIIRVPDALVPDHLKMDLDWRCHLAADTSRLRSELGYAEGLPLEDRFSRTVAWERANPPAQINAALFDYQAEDRCLARIDAPGWAANS